jgi:hypothetical protein
VENLEERSLLAAGTASVVGRTLVLQGTPDADFVSVFEKHDQIQVFWGSATGGLQGSQTLREHDVRRIVFNGNGGSDTLFNGTEFRVTTTGTVQVFQSGNHGNETNGHD